LVKTLYDLLGALAHDDADALRSAFRKAVKGAHPDLRPSDPDAAEKFREIVRAHEILGDPEQREVYDDLLERARQEQVFASQQLVAGRRWKIAAGLIAIVGASAASTAGFLLFTHISAGSVTSALNLDIALPWTAAQTSADSAAADNHGLVGNLAGTDAQSTAGGEGQRVLNDRLAQLDQPDPAYLPSYMDDRVINFRSSDSAGAFGDGARTKPSDTTGQAKSAAKSHRVEQSPIARFVRRLARQRWAANENSWGDGS
jgi:curved DNA-binding protein CbpA